MGKETLIKNIEDLGNEIELQHPEYYSCYSAAIDEVVQLIKTLNIDIVSKNNRSEVKVSCTTCKHILNYAKDTPCDTCFTDCENWEE